MKTSWIGPIIAGGLLIFGLGLAFVLTMPVPFLDRSVETDDPSMDGRPLDEEIPSTLAPTTRAGLKASNLKLSGPFTHENLTIFLVHGKDQISDKNFLTLEEALKEKKGIVHEAGEVGVLTIENRSDRDVIFVQAGDIVKGGNQDRVIPYDYLVPPKSGRQPLAAFCVEQGRSSKRGDEDDTHFSSSTAILATKQLKLAARYRKAQDEVWQQVGEIQEKLAQNVRTKVRSDLSNSSLQLSLENRKVQLSADAYVNRLASLIAGRKDVIGFAFAVNGKINSAEVYGSHILFQKLWPRLLKASAIEAVAELDKDQKLESASIKGVQGFLADVEKGRASQQQVTPRIAVVLQETDNNVLFETRDGRHEGAWIHRSYFTK
jgi:hypothetical protein